ncbi:MAG: glutathione S-transferase family protein [Pseudomonadota bacterium]
MTYVLYGYPGSGSMAVEMALAEIGADYRIQDVDLTADAQRSRSYASINPQRKLPALLTVAGETLTESVAILLTLDQRHPEANLLPKDAIDRAQSLRWLMFVATEIYPIVEINDYPNRFSPKSELANDVRELARAIWRERWLVVEREIAGTPYLLNSGFCVTDIYIAVVSRWAQQGEWRSEHCPRIEALTAAVAARPKLASIWSNHGQDDNTLTGGVSVQQVTGSE